ncbi:aminotransferase family protein [Virgibacillus sp. W0181]|uniref:aminotransferase family protein n=1 Tax=Virgibacillus sp. W0181 TaxID=3391581 RepID=UPI003F44EDFB
MTQKVKDAVFHRDLNKKYPIITHGEGIYLYDQSGKRYIDASSGAVAANLGHSNNRIAQAMADQAMKVGFVHSMRFETEVLHHLAEKIVDLAPRNLKKVYFTSGGSEANESAIKLARQYHRDNGDRDKHIVIGRWQSYHGNTLGSLSVGGDIKRRKPYMPNLINTEHVYSPYCRRCPYQRNSEDCSQRKNWSCVKDLETKINNLGSENISAIIMEPIVGSQQGAVVPPKDYFKEVRKLCDSHDIVLIIDEVMTGFGRTGKNFAIEHFEIVPDIITFGKGVSAGYAPLAGMIVSDKIIESTIKNSAGKFIHGYTYSGHPVTAAAGLAAMEIYEEDSILNNCIQMSKYLIEKLDSLKSKSNIISDVRGKGLLIGIELVKDKESNILFDPIEQVSNQINEIAFELGAVFYPGSGGIDGLRGEHLIISPPLNVNKEEIDEMVTILEKVIDSFENDMK